MDSHSLEAFALATDRTKALEQFIPGTDDHYFHACLVHEQNGNLKEVDLLLTQWNKRLGETQRFQEIRNRRALLGYDTAKEATLEHLRYHLGLNFHHARDVEGATTDFPTRLDVSTVSRDAIKNHGYGHSNSSDLTGFTDAAIEWLADEPADGQRLRSLLQRMKRPDHAKLVGLVAAELKDKHTSGFGALPIHNLMLHDQLQALLKHEPALKNVDAFVQAWLTKLQPGPDVDWQNNAVEREAWLTRLWDFVHDLAPKFNPLKAHVLFHRLDHDRRQGVVDRARFLTYLKLPRQVSYANGDYLKKFVNDERPFGLGQDYRQVTLHAVVNNDEELVRDLLGQVFRDATDMKPYDTLISDGFLKQIFASTKMLNGIGDMEKWFSIINDPAFCQALKEKIEIAFAPTNPVWFQADQAVTLAVDVKNVTTLTVKVFEVNTLNYFLANGRDVDTSVDLDGLIASEEQTVTYSEAPMRRVRRSFSFPTLSKPGVYIVELIGGGISSRALIRKGKLRFVERVGAAGHVFTVLDEARNVVTDASIWLGGHEYRPNAQASADGSITIPFSARPGRQTILLRQGAITALETFQHQSEDYALSAGLYVDRESLLKKKEATLVVRAGLSVNGVPVALKLLEEVTLIIQSTDRDGVSASHEISDFALFEEKESVHTFQVPEKLAAMSFKLRAKVQNLSQAKKIELSAENGVTVNGIDAEAIVEGLHLSRTASGFVVHHLGKSGEARAASALNFTLQHRDLVPALHCTLQTDSKGRVELGHLRDIHSVSATTPSGVSERWSLPRDSARTTGMVHVRVGEAFRVPFMGVAPLLVAAGKELPSAFHEFPDALGKTAAPEVRVERADAALLERHGAGFVRDHFTALSRTDGYLDVAGLPAGDYELFLKRDQTSIAIRVVPGADRAGWITGDKRHIERRNARPLQIAGVTAGEQELTVTLGNAGELTRIHVFATRFVPSWSSANAFSRGAVPGGRAVEVFRAQSNYVSGRDIGDEYRYILERRQAKTFAGNMLARPGLLLNPWAVRGTETAMQDARAGGMYGASPAPSMQAMAPPPPEPWQQGGAGSGGSAANLDFLAHPAVVLTNLVPDREGRVRIPRAALQHANQIRIVAVDSINTVCRDALLPEAVTPHADLRLKLALDADLHFSEKKQITALEAGQPLEIADITTAKTEVYDTLGRVYRLYATLTHDAHLTTFGFILRWLTLTESEKQAKYSEFACHELSFFVSRKDPEFFERVIKPYLRNKMHKTFMDRYLLGDDLGAYRKSWAFQQLNIVERILLSRRFDDEGGPVARHGRDSNDLIPRDVERANHLFASAIQGSALEAGDALGIGAQVMKAESVALHALGSSFGAPGGGGARGESREESAKSRRPMAPAAAAPARMKEKSAKKMARARDSEMEMEDMPSEVLAEADARPGGDFDKKDSDVASRGGMRQFYQKLDTTMEWAENNWWHLTIEQQGPKLIGINAFWRDFANHRGGPFLSSNLAVAAGNFAEMMCALAVLDLPFAADKPTVTFDGARMTFVSKGLSVAFHKEIKPVEPSTERVPVLVSQNYFRDDDRTRYERDEAVDNYVTGEFLINVVYVCQVVLTNPTSSHQKLDLLLQIPSGAIPVRNGFVTQGKHIELSSYATESIEYAFYFPATGSFPHFPVHVAKNEQLVASTPPSRLEVVRQLTTVDKSSWAWLSQHGSDDDVLTWMDANNVDRIAVADGNGAVFLERIAWRMKDRAFYDACIALLTRRHIWNNTLWAYAVMHDDVPNIREFLKHQDSFLDRCGLWLESPLVAIDAVERKRYQHLEYAPLVNARTQKLGPRRRILNDRFSQQYTALMGALRYKKTLSPTERLAVAYYLFLQDRIDEALALVDSVEPGSVEATVQADLLRVYAEFSRERPEIAREVATRHKDMPVDRWRSLFRNALAQLDEISGSGAQVVDEKDRDQRQAQLAASEPDFELTIEKKTVSIAVQNLATLRVNYYRMDIELLFSRQPFVQQQSAQFSFIKPNRSDDVVVAAGQTTVSFALPAEYAGANVIIEVVAAGRRKSQACYAHELSLQIVENYGQVRVAHQATGKPLSKTYVKVYSRMQGGEVRFFKDGYTDQRGVFDYTSLNSNELDVAERFSLLILNDQHGGVIREASPPKR